MHKLSFTLSVALLSLSLSSYAAEPPTETTAVVVVNGVAISDAELKHFVSKLSKPVPAERALQELINVELLVQAAKSEGVANDQALLLEIRRTASGLIASHYLQQKLQQLDITEDDLKARYASEYIDGNKNLEYNANHILLDSEQEAVDVILQLDSGKDFGELAKQLSTGPSGKNGGALGWFKAGDMVAPFSEATTRLEAVQYSKNPVKTQFGWHVIQLNDSRMIAPPTLESVEKELSTAIAAEAIGQIMQSLREAAKIETK